MTKKIRQYGTWASPLSAKSLAAGLRLNDVQWDTADDTLVWLEGRGAQGVLVAQKGMDAPRDLTTAEMPVRAHVGYGGGDFTVFGGQVYFSGPEGRLYRQSLEGGDSRAITPAFGNAASPRVSPDGKWIVYVHSYLRVDGLAVVDVEGELWPQKLAFGTDFVMQPAWHPDGRSVAYIAWEHPQMPWDGTELRLVTLGTGVGGAPYCTAIETLVGDETTAIFQPEFSPDGRYLSYVSDATDWGQLYVYDLAEKTHKALTAEEAEHGQPAWSQGQRSYGWTHDSRALYFLRNANGFFSLWRYDMSAGKAEQVKTLDSYPSMLQIAVSPRREAVALIGSSPVLPARVINYEPEGTEVPLMVTPPEAASIQVLVEEPARMRIHRRSSTENVPAAQLAQAEAIQWTGHDGETVHGLYYAPTSEQFEGVGTPPLMVLVHGGPTGQRAAAYDSDVQFFATRGFAVLHVNYRGSTGYGKAYMNKLRGNWGIYDVEDSASGALHLVEGGLADKEKLVIMGGSAGGFTVLQSLIEKPGLYKAGVCLYGVSNHFLLAQDTHKFEERYLDSMLGPLPQAADKYRSRSPVFHAEKIADPIIVFQGADDIVVPQNQSDDIVASLRARGVAHDYHIYQGEGHGFRKPETLEAYYNSTMQFLTQHVLYA